MFPRTQAVPAVLPATCVSLLILRHPRDFTSHTSRRGTLQIYVRYSWPCALGAPQLFLFVCTTNFAIFVFSRDEVHLLVHFFLVVLADPDCEGFAASWRGKLLCEYQTLSLTWHRFVITVTFLSGATIRGSVCDTL